MVATVELERWVTQTGVFGVVIGKFRHWEEPCLVILLSIHENTKVSLYNAVLLLRLTVYLRVERDGEFSLDVEEVTQREPTLGHKNRSPVTYDGVRKAVMSYHHVYNYFR